MWRNTFYFLLLIGVISCIKPPDYPDIPELEFVGLSKDTMNQSSFNTDSVVAHLSFTDGDGDIGSDDSLNVFVTDLRDGFLAYRFRMPPVPPEGANNGISADLWIVLYTTCCVYDNGDPPCSPSTQFPTNAVQYGIYITDNSGNRSNTVETPPITLLCN